MKHATKIILSLTCFFYCITGFAGEKGNPACTTLNDIQMLSSFLYTSTGNIADGNRAVFDALFSNGIDGNDAIKLMNPGENFGLTRNNNKLAIEARQPVNGADTLFYFISNLRPQVYKLDIEPQNLQAYTETVRCELVDRFLNTRSNISLTDINHINIEVTADPESKSANRLMLVFSKIVIQLPPVEISSISAFSNKDRSNSIKWQTEHELNAEKYFVERGKDADHFESIASILPIYSDDNGGAYQFIDFTPMNSDNYYRIRSLDKSGATIYSNIVKVKEQIIKTSLTLYPNPVTSYQFQLQFPETETGNYNMKLVNDKGQVVYTSLLRVNKDNLNQRIRLSNNLSKGNYFLNIVGSDGNVSVKKLIIQ